MLPGVISVSCCSCWTVPLSSLQVRVAAAGGLDMAKTEDKNLSVPLCKIVLGSGKLPFANVCELSIGLFKLEGVKPRLSSVIVLFVSRQQLNPPMYACVGPPRGT